MENFTELMQRLLEIQRGGRQRSPELIAEDERLMDGLQKRNLAGKPPQNGKAYPRQPRADAIQGLTLPPWSNDAEMRNRARQQVGSTTGFCPQP